MTSQKYEAPSQPSGSSRSSESGAKQRVPAVITKEQREHMIAEAAYYIAEHRHFEGGDPIHDWMQAQMEIDSKIKSSSH